MRFHRKVRAYFCSAALILLAAIPARAQKSSPAPAADSKPAPMKAAPAATPATLDESTYTVRLRDLEHQIGQMKDDVYRSKARLQLFSAMVLDSAEQGARAVIIHNDKLRGTLHP